MALMRKMVLNRALNLCSQGHALDLGCGPGYLVAELAQSSADLFVTGIDLSEQALIEARQRIVLASINDRVDLRYGDAVEIPLPDNTIDLVVSTLSLHHWNSPVDVFNEINRVLRPGGSFIIFDLRRDMSMPFWLLICFVSNVVVPQALRQINEPMASRDAAYTPAEAQQLVSASSLTGWQVDAGPLWLFIEGKTEPENWQT
jgi:ubiquinone/menaquinone biosynthesis C-methylase UbiE